MPPPKGPSTSSASRPNSPRKPPPTHTHTPRPKPAPGPRCARSSDGRPGGPALPEALVRSREAGPGGSRALQAAGTCPGPPGPPPRPRHSPSQRRGRTVIPRPGAGTAPLSRSRCRAPGRPGTADGPRASWARRLGVREGRPRPCAGAGAHPAHRSRVPALPGAGGASSGGPTRSRRAQGAESEAEGRRRCGEHFSLFGKKKE